MKTAVMTSRDRILCSLKHQMPDRVPFSWGFGPTSEMSDSLEIYGHQHQWDWKKLRKACEDIQHFIPCYRGPDLSQGTDIWGIRRKTISYSKGAYQEFDLLPLAGMDSVEQIKKHAWPSADGYDYQAFGESLELRDRNRATKYTVGNVFETYCWMTGLEEAMVNLMVAPELVVSALEKITSFYEKRLKRALQAGGPFLDILFLADDLGSQQGLLISRKCYRQIIQPYHRRLVEIARCMAPHAKIMFHTDGSVFEILPDLIETGIDILEAVQTDAAGMDPQRLKEIFGKQISFHGAISVQKLLPHSTPDEVRRQCRELVEILGREGGYIAAPSHAIQIGTPPENVLAMLETVLGQETLQEALDQSGV